MKHQITDLSIVEIFPHIKLSSLFLNTSLAMAGFFKIDIYDGNIIIG